MKKFKTQNSKLKILILLCALFFTLEAQAQFNILVTCEIDSADSVIAQITDHKLAGGTTILADSLGYLDTFGKKFAGIVMDTAITSTTFEFYTSNTTTAADFKKVQYDGSDVSLTVADDQQCGLKPTEVNQFLRYIKIEGSAAEAYKRTIKLILTNF